VTDTLRRDFVAGLLAFVPTVTTLAVVFWVFSQLDNLVLPKLFRLIGMAGPQPRFAGIVVTLALILLAGALTRSIVGRSLLGFWEKLIDRVPVARSLYLVLKQFMEAIFTKDGHPGFRRVVLVEYSRRGIWSYGFITGRMSFDPAGGAELLKVFIPKTPNPTTGYYVLVPREEVRASRLSVEEAFRAIISAGIATDQDDWPGSHIELGARPDSEPAERKELAP
jgi:uncharacterized membrane protein